jgi:hypothetical protein
MRKAKQLSSIAASDSTTSALSQSVANRLTEPRTGSARMSHRLKLPVLIGIIAAACTGEGATAPAIGGDLLLAKWSGEFASAADGIVAASIAVNNESRDINRIRLQNTAAYLGAINLDATHASAQNNACQTVGDANVALGLIPYLTHPSTSRTHFGFSVSLPELGLATSTHHMGVFWDEPATKRQLYLTIGKTNPSDATFPNQFPIVNQTGSVYTLTGGIVTLRVSYGKPVRNASLVCPNLDAVSVTYPAP